MTKKDPSPQPEPTGANHTEVHVETESEQTISTGDDRVAELTADLQRLQAEFQNYRRRAEADRADLMSLATARVVREFLAVRDSFDAESQHRPASADPGWAKSIDAIRTQFDQILATLGVTRFESLGQAFDPHRHEAVATEGDGATIIEELQPGYELAGRVLRPAIVKVGPESDPAQHQ